MTRRTSTRALAREIYRESIMQETPTPNPSPHPPSPCGLRRTSGGGETTDLTERVRALYEGSAVPVREIAARAGVTERTIYKYAAKHAWKPRYRWTPDGARPRAWRPRVRFAPAKGAGRFIRRDDKGKPIAAGLKATDAQGAARAGAACANAQALAQQAQAEAEKDRRFEDYMRAHAAMLRALEQLRRHRDEQAKLPPAQRMPADHLLWRALQMSVAAAIDDWEARGRAWHEAQNRTGAA
jgi:hypothetical protein